MCIHTHIRKDLTTPDFGTSDAHLDSCVKSEVSGWERGNGGWFTGRSSLGPDPRAMQVWGVHALGLKVTSHVEVNTSSN